MSSYQIREYRDADYADMRLIYSTGFREHAGTVYLQALQWAQALLCGVFLLLQVFFVSFLTCIVSIGGVLLVIRILVQYFFKQGIQLGLSEDLLDIRSSYMQTGCKSCFWVAEEKGSIVGTVGILPCVEEPGAWELKRISVKWEFRGRGVAKALCKAALEFVARHNVRRVVLFTSMVQTDAHKLYNTIGFQKEEEFVWPSLPGRLIEFIVFKYAHRNSTVISF
ncbi:probable N-acetyltransferase family 8 member 5 [Danio rerio]|uniref:Probable N-acetyltransferase family 8 member 5 n=1 Tax=Danio rerio TaxID=7955 RepID=A0A8M9PYZ3_DANRE|nr:probable N-acetyltransferase CML5 [Danio rerio]|eukprot:XP_021336617.1 probable N-acetyltransferase CML5 [Danio rerio]